MKVLVTGGTGFVGLNLVLELLEAGATVRVLARPTSNLAPLREAVGPRAIDVVRGDLLDPPSLRAALAGVEVLYHVAADYRLWAPDPAVLYRANVEGTRSLLAAAEAAGVGRIVYTSSVGTLGIPLDGTPGTEATPVGLADMVGDYKRSKFLAEREAEAAAARGVPVVIVNPSAPIGPWDWKPTPTGKMLVDYLRGRMFAYLETGLNVVHVRDVARGHILAAARGRVGERYVLGHAGGQPAPARHLRPARAPHRDSRPPRPAPARRRPRHRERAGGHLARHRGASRWPRGRRCAWRPSACSSIPPGRSRSSASPRRRWSRRSRTLRSGSGPTATRGGGASCPAGGT